MTVSELIQALQDCDQPDSTVVVHDQTGSNNDWYEVPVTDVYFDRVAQVVLDVSFPDEEDV